MDAADGFRRYLLRACPDGARVESVRIPLFDTHHIALPLVAGRLRLACAFCATGRLGLTRNLEAWEMVAQLLEVRAGQPSAPSPAWSSWGRGSRSTTTTR